MPKPKSDPKQTAATGVPPTMTIAAPAMAKAWADIMEQSAQFLAQRLQEDMSTQRALLACKTPQEVVQVQSEFVFKAMQQYAQETQRMVERMTEATDDMTKLARQGWSRSYDDIPL